MAVVYNNDLRYPGPVAHPAPPNIHGLPTQADLDAFPRMFTWGELKGIIRSGDLGQLMRNKALQARYDDWSKGMKAQFGSTERYLTTARLPWSTSPLAEPTFDQRTALDHPDVDLTPATRPAAHVADAGGAASGLATAASTPARSRAPTVGGAPSGASTPASAGFVSLANVVPRLRKLVVGSEHGSDAGHAAAADDAEEEDEPVVHLHYDAQVGFETDKYAVLPNDWPYCVPYGVRHFCVWSRIPIAHPSLVDYDPTAWAIIEDEGLGGFTGVTPIDRSQPPTPDTVYPVPPTPASPTRSRAAAAAMPLSPKSVAGDDNDGTVPDVLSHQGRTKQIRVQGKHEWYAVDVAHAGPEMRRWAGVDYEAAGGHEVGRMVRALWDERGWECLWFVNPPSVPGFSHFHVFARRKTPDEIDAAEAAHAAA